MVRSFLRGKCLRRHRRRAVQVDAQPELRIALAEPFNLGEGAEIPPFDVPGHDRNQDPGIRGAAKNRQRAGIRALRWY